MFGRSLSVKRGGWGVILCGATPIVVSVDAVDTAVAARALIRAEVRGWGATGRIIALRNS